MSKKVSKEETITEYFNTEENLGKIEVTFNIVKGIMKRRLTTTAKPAKTPKAPKTTAVKPADTTVAVAAAA